MKLQVLTDLELACSLESLVAPRRADA